MRDVIAARGRRRPSSSSCMPGWAKNLVVGFARLDGRAVGVVANQPAQLERPARHRRRRQGRPVRALLRRVQPPAAHLRRHARVRAGQGAGARRACIRDAAKLLYAFCEATVPKLTVVTAQGLRRGATRSCAPSTSGPTSTSPGRRRRSPPAATGRARVRPVGTAHSPYRRAAKRGYLDDVIEPAETRPRLIAALEACASKREGPSAQEARQHPAVSASADSGEASAMPTSKNPVHITDLVLRDAHQSLLATRMRTEDMLPIADKLNRAGYWSLEMWGGATFDSMMRFLNEDPWERVRALKAAMPDTRLQMLLRGQNVVGYRNYADDVVREFVRLAAQAGIDVFRVFDALNDPRNLADGHRGGQGERQVGGGHHQLHQEPGAQRAVVPGLRGRAGGDGRPEHLHQGHGRPARSPATPTSW